MSRQSNVHDSDVLARVVMTLLLVGAVVGAFALAKWAQPMLAEQHVQEAQERCQAINDSGEQREGELAECMQRLAHIEAVQRR
jgi:uncharacterized protein YcfJ